MKKKLFSLLAVFCLFASITTNVFAMERIKPGDGKQASEKEIAEMANELEYIFTNIIVKDESTGKYTVDKSELNNSSYTAEEKAGMNAFVENILNDDSSLASNNLVSAASSNVFKKCMSEALGIYGNSLDQFINYVDKGDWVGAAGVLAFWGISVHPVTVFIFAMNCGAGSAS